ncbi:MAG TPA: glycosyltransferase family 4 protein [Anaerolineales bacterium]|nr:glycosyltransferase family 4 protein [Anaerolineales bacterium]
MKILFFSGDYWPNNGGIAAHVYYLSRALARIGHQVTVLGGAQKNVKSLSSTPSSAGGNLHEIIMFRKGPRIVKGVVFLMQSFFLLRVLSRQKWDVIHFHNFVPDGLLLGILPWPEAKIRVMTNHSSQYLIALEKQRPTLLYQTATRMVNGFIAPSNELLEKTAPIMRQGQAAKYIPNGVDLTTFTPGIPTDSAYELLDVDKTRTIILTVRRHSPKCGLDYLIHAIPTIISKYPDVVFCLLGDGEQTAELKNLASELKIQNSVRFPGRVLHDQLPNVLRAAYLTILPSLYEAVSLAGLESMACGIPVVGTRVGGIPEFVLHKETGILIEPQSSVAIARAVMDLIEKPALRNEVSLNAHNLVRQKYSWDSVAQTTVDFYQALSREN